MTTAKTLSQQQINQLVQWVNQAVPLKDIQNLISSEWQLSLTYMEVRLLLSELNLELPIKSKPSSIPLDQLLNQPNSNSPTQGSVKVTRDKVVRPGTLVSGTVQFSDGKTAVWYVDQQGRLGLVPPEPNYQPSPQDIQNFQTALDQELQKAGF